MNKQDTIGGDNLGGATRKLILIVQTGIDGGWKDKDTECGINKSEIFGSLIEFNDCVMSISDLITDAGFMKAVYGEEIVLEWGMWRENYLHVSMSAHNLLLTNATPDAAIEYLYKEMK